jgi:hypothetical protein
MAKMGRPKKEVDFDMLEKLCSISCTADECATILKMSVDTIERALKSELELTFAAFYKRHAGQGKVSLRRKQFEVAMTGNVSMLIWLGKQWLGQTDKQESYGEQKISVEKITYEVID